MSATSIPIREELVGAPLSFEEHFGTETDDVDFIGLLEASSSEQTIGSTYCDTYLRAADASTALEVSQKMSDYLIDINIYWYVLQNYIMKLRYNFLNRKKNVRE